MGYSVAAQKRREPCHLQARDAHIVPEKRSVNCVNRMASNLGLMLFRLMVPLSWKPSSYSDFTRAPLDFFLHEVFKS